MKSQDVSILFVNPVRRQSAQGRHLRSYKVLDPRSGQIIDSKLKHTTREDSVTSTYGFLIDFNRDKIVSGLDDSVVNPFKGGDIDDIIVTYSLSEDWRDSLEKIIEMPKIKKQTLFEIEASVKEGTYTSAVTSPTIFNAGPTTKVDDSKASYLQTFKFTLYDRPNRFDSSTPRGRLIMQAVKRNPKIALNSEVVNTALHDWYISEENEAEVNYNAKRKLVKQAVYQLQKLELEATPFRRYQVASLLKNKNGEPIIVGEVNAAKLESEMNRYIDDKNPNYLKNIEQFLELVGYLESPEGVDKFHVMAVLQQALNTHTMYARDGVFRWPSKTGTANLEKFTSFDAMVNFFKKEYINYSESEGEEITNWYKDLIDEIEAKGGILK